ncbi:MAG: site-specific integrase [Tannerella sp.]|jgi:integrase|nr:site-specific integrase [Tannerella sp.]
MKLSAFIDTRRANKNGRYPVKIRIKEGNNYVCISLGIDAIEHEFDNLTGQFIVTKENKQNAIRYNNTITSEYVLLMDIIKENEKKGARLSPNKLKQLYMQPKNTKEVSFNDYFRSFINNKTEKGTKAIYITTLNMIEELYSTTLYFEDINHSWLEGYERKMKAKGLSVNYISIQLRNIRAVFNNAIDNEVASLNIYPFRRFKIKTEQTRKRNIAIEEIRALFNYQGNEYQMWAIDMAKLIFFFIGINVKDLFLLSTFENGYAVYRRAKTKTIYKIRIEPEAEAILQKYRLPDGQYTFQRQFLFHQAFIKKINKYLKEITTGVKFRSPIEEYKKKTPILPHITTYTLRHTWATIAADLEIPKETIAAALGHSQNTVTDIYINFNQKKIDEANRKVIDAVMGKDVKE